MPFSVRDSLRGKHIFITGGTGFLGLALIEKLVREIDSCSLSLLIRAEDDKKANRRFQAILDQEALFDDQDKSRYSKIRCYAGDISRENLGLSEAALAALKPDLDIVIHAAASVNFDDPINVAIENNIYGPLHVLEFCRQTEAALLHVSTAYVCGNLTGPIQADVTEDMLNRLDGGSASAELAHMEQMLARFQKENATLSSKRRIKALMELGKEYALGKGWSDIYTLTKFVCEQLLREKREQIPLTVFRPTIIESTLQDPVPGWLKGIKVMDLILAAYGKGIIRGFPCDLDAELDLIPVDMVVSALIAAAARMPEREAVIYQLGTSGPNPFYLRDVASLAYRHYSRHPLKDKEGNIIKVPRPTMPSMQNHQRKMAFAMHSVRALASLLRFTHLQNILHPLYHFCKSSEKRLQRGEALVSLFSNYTTYRRQFDTASLDALFAALSEEEKRAFNFDPYALDWQHYMENVHFHGLQKLLK